MYLDSTTYDHELSGDIVFIAILALSRWSILKVI